MARHFRYAVRARHSRMIIGAIEPRAGQQANRYCQSNSQRHDRESLLQAETPGTPCIRAAKSDGCRNAARQMVIRATGIALRTGYSCGGGGIRWSEYFFYRHKCGSTVVPCRCRVPLCVAALYLPDPVGRLSQTILPTDMPRRLRVRRRARVCFARPSRLQVAARCSWLSESPRRWQRRVSPIVRRSR